jgi:hypothetical protein
MTSRPSTTARLLALSALMAVLIGGCASQSTASPTPLTPTASPIATASPAPTPTPSPTPKPLPQGSEVVVLDPANFVARIDNPYWPMIPGSRWIYHETDAEGADQRVEITVSNETKMILGINATVLHDVLTEDGVVVEDTFDWYAQDLAGNIWYLGEDTKEYDAGKVVSTAGSWEAGVNGGQPGIILPGKPQVGLTYRQEYLAGEAEDSAKILSLTEHADVPFGAFDNVLMTEETTVLEPDLLEQKFYARGIGEVRAMDVSGGTSKEELISYVPGATN